jgi:general stress protein 26
MLMTRPELVDLSTLGIDGFPQTRSVANLRNTELYPQLGAFFQEQPYFRVFLATHARSEKVKQIRENRKISVYFISPKESRSLLLIGKAVRVKDRGIKELLWQEDWEQFYSGGPLGRSFAVFRLDPCTAKGWWENRPFSFPVAPIP